MSASQMELYLAQHGESASEDADPARPLTERGRAEVELVAPALHRMNTGITRIYHSGKLRARQTADLFARALGGVAAAPADGLAPKDDPTVARHLVEQLAGPGLLVGHLPHLSRLASLLLAGDPSRELIAFRMGGVVCLARDDTGRWRVRWMITPGMFGAERG